MKKKNFLHLLAFFYLPSFGQVSVSIVPGQSNIYYLEKKSSATQAATAVRNVDIKLSYSYSGTKPSSDVTVTFQIKDISAGANTIDPDISLNSDFIISKDSFSTAIKNVAFTVPVVIKAVPTLTGSEIFSISIASLSPSGTLDSKLQKVVIQNTPIPATDNTQIDDDSPYWVEIGSNFDFDGGPQLSNIAGGILFHKLDNSFGNKDKSRIALLAGAYESKIITDVSNNPYQINSFITDKSFLSGRNDSIWRYDYGGKPKQTKTIRNWSFFASPSTRLGKGSVDDGRLHLFASFWAELRYQEVQVTNNNDNLILIDSVKVTTSNLGNYKQLKDSISKAGIYSHYYGFGVPLYYQDKTVKVFINWAVGYSNQPSYKEFFDIANLEYGHPVWRPFYMVQFRLTERKFGLSITGEIRGLIKQYSQPSYTLALTKKFSLEKLMNYP